MARLIVRTGADEGCVFPLAAGVALVGRNADNAIVLSDTAVSRHHAQIVRRGDLYYIRDLDSTHGTFVNGARNTREQPLQDNDLVRIGNTDLLFTTRAEDPAGLVPAPEDSVSAAPAAPSDDQPIAGLAGKTIAFSLPVEKRPARGGLSEQHLEILSRVAEATQSVFDLDELLRILMDMIFEAFRPDRGVVFLGEATGGALAPRVTRPAEGDFQISRTIVDHAVRQRMSLLVSDTAMDLRFSAAQSIVAQSILSAICSPLVCKDRVLGALYIDTQARLISFQKEDLALLNIIAANAAIAIDNAVLVQQKLEAERLAAMGVAVAGISHYVKNVLFGITGSSNLIETGLSSENYKMVKDMWPVLRRSTLKISSLVQDMLTYSKKREPALELGNLNAVLREIHDNQAPRALELGVELVLALDEALPDSQFEIKAIHDTLLNIVGNAIEACAKQPQARVELRSDRAGPPPQVRAWVIDNGPGIPPEIRKKIFEPFFSTKGSKGTGLGLAVAQKTVEEHHGRLILESEPGKGAAFQILLPLEAPPPPADTAKG